MKSWGLFASGLLFGVGLVVSGMTQPGKVMAFLDVAGAWDPSLAFVMAGAIGTHALGRYALRKRAKPLLDASFHEPEFTKVDVRLVAGSALFGLGWGLGGYCPGPGIVSLVTGNAGTLLFVAGMIFGMWAFQLLDRRTASRV